TRRPQKYAAARDDVVRADSSQFGAGVEASGAGIKAYPNHEAVLMPEQLIAVGRLTGYTKRCRSRAGTIDLGKDGIGRKRIYKLLAVQAERGRRVVAEAQKSHGRAAALGIRRVSVHGPLIEAPHMRDAF